ncbi:MAG: response regulator [Candidatus Methylomirabilales bacterium]
MQIRPILVIDDDPRFCELVTDTLSGTGFEVHSAPDGSSGIELARAAQPAVILLDMMMPGVDGIATCKRLKQDRVVGDIPVIGITASPDPQYTEEAFHAGAELFLAKPIGVKSLTHVVNFAAQRVHRETGHRVYPRFPAALAVGCLVPAGDADTTRQVAGRTGNVSLGGLLLFLPERLSPGIVLGLLLALPLPTEPITAEGTVTWQGPQPTGDGKTPHGIRLLRFMEHFGLPHYQRYLSRIALSTAA